MKSTSSRGRGSTTKAQSSKTVTGVAMGKVNSSGGNKKGTGRTMKYGRRGKNG